ncbi:MAG: CDP-diacylglycerol--glycerol-3-phosphate 3-phosphatidyltransferase [Planctomycetota bacterium]|jgi:CDP-diacylglycerol--glycerol-3-phosphate 3-phosphatidyltransferase
MAETLKADSESPSPWNVPNALSFVRLILAMVVCGLIEYQSWMSAAILFMVAASTDWVDGWWARRYQQVTKLGRILDPFVDKVIICGAMIALVGADGSPIPPWVATLVVARELLVTSLRGLVEGKGGDFSAKQLGKWKMVAQCAAVVSALLYLRYETPPAWLSWTTQILLWASVLLTVVSAIEYIFLVVRGSSRSATG